MIAIRQEQAGDQVAIRELNIQAFDQQSEAAHTL